MLSDANSNAGRGKISPTLSGETQEARCMHRAPQEEEDPQSDKLSPPSQRRKRRANPEFSTSASSPYFEDEHPEIPLVRRATRHLKIDETEPATSQRTLRPRQQTPPAVKLAP